MSGGLFEVWRDGNPTGRLFLSEANAILWLSGHRESGAQYEIKPFSPW